MTKKVENGYFEVPYNYFEKHHMIIIRSFKDGLIKETLFFKMLIHSAKHRGNLRVNAKIPYTVNSISSVFSTPVEIVEEALEEFQKLGVLEILDDGTLFFKDLKLTDEKEAEPIDTLEKNEKEGEDALWIP